VVGIDVVYGVKTSSRIDPLGVQLKAGPLYEAKGEQSPHWTLDESDARVEKKKAKTLGKDGRPSEANHGNVTPSISDTNREGEYIAGGVTLDHAEQTAVLSLAALRRLRFPLPGGAWEPTPEQKKRDEAARTVLAALALTAAALADEAGMDFRSRCLLWPEGAAKWEHLSPSGDRHDTRFNADEAIRVLTEAVLAAKDCGLPWRSEPLVLSPSKQLVKLVAKSQTLAIEEGGDGGED
jgi:CRISPR-associated protein Csb1